MQQQLLKPHDNNGQRQLVQNFTNKNFKEFYWNKDQFQSQSLMVFKKRALGFSANISWLFSKALFAYTAACIYSEKRKKKNKPIQQVILAQSTHTTVLLCWHIVTLTHLLVCLLMNSFTMDFDRNKRCNTVIMSECFEKTRYSKNGGKCLSW